MGRLLLLFVLVPALELVLLIEIGSRIGTLPTLGLIALTGVVGAALARRQGLGVLTALRRESQEGRLPAGPLFDGLLVLIAAALLVTPGVLTDAAGFLCLVPAFRRALRRRLRRHLEAAVREGRVVVLDTRGFEAREEKEVRDVGRRDASGRASPPPRDERLP